MLACFEQAGATWAARSTDQREADALFQARRLAYPALERLGPVLTEDVCVPRQLVPEMLARIETAGIENGVHIANLAHAGDGNLHPLICYDESVPGETDRAADVAGEILSYCVEAGGSITGEHGVGADKAQYMPRMFTDDDLDVMQRVRAAFDPRNLSNPGKVFPTPRLCGEVPGPYRRHPVEQAGLAERF